jgi:hypothetical protein
MMSKNVVKIVQDGSYRAAQPSQVLVVEGDTIEFSAEPGDGTILVLTSETADILSPTPATVVEVSGGASVSFQILRPTGVDYRAQVLPEGSEPRPIEGFSSQDAPILTILSSDNRDVNVHTGRGL